MSDTSAPAPIAAARDMAAEWRRCALLRGNPGARIAAPHNLIRYTAFAIN
ncbi:protein of unknown function [Ralstonia solanacearum CFBP2957]|nr:protein of unknown function [Ralstonia solanacearum CFBP2957]